MLDVSLIFPISFVFSMNCMCYVSASWLFTYGSHLYMLWFKMNFRSKWLYSLICIFLRFRFITVILKQRKIQIKLDWNHFDLKFILNYNIHTHTHTHAQCYVLAFLHVLLLCHSYKGDLNKYIQVRLSLHIKDYDRIFLNRRYSELCLKWTLSGPALSPVKRV